ncbi:MAG: DUF4375 domain-containing protein [Gammaproteobacteria bacterium]|nr:DUF4375 domain-containing protein [Gammaproteobacteria bacterium]
MAIITTLTLRLLVWVILLVGVMPSMAGEPVSSLDFLQPESTDSELTLEQMQAQEAVVQSVWWFEKMVLKGGFQHYLLISDPDLIEQIFQDLQTIGALKIKELLLESVTIVYNGSPAEEREKRVRLLAQLTEKQRTVLLKLNQQFLQQRPILRQRIVVYLQTG